MTKAMTEVRRKSPYARCARCKRSFKKAALGRPRKFCGRSCRQAAYLKRAAHRPRPVELLAADLAHAKVRNWLRREIWDLLMQAGLVSAPEPPPTPARGPRRPQPKLEIVSGANEPS
jgi:hypothetical protein